MILKINSHCTRLIGLYLASVGASSAMAAESLCFTGETTFTLHDRR